MDIKINQIAIVDEEELEVKIHFDLKGENYFGILSLKSGAFISNLVNISEEENHEVLHYLGHKAAEYLEQNGITVQQEHKCDCH